MPIPQNGQTHLNNSLAIADELFECVWPFCGIGTSRVNFEHIWNNIQLDPFHVTSLFLYPLKTSENLWFFVVFSPLRKTVIRSRLLADISELVSTCSGVDSCPALFKFESCDSFTCSVATHGFLAFHLVL